MSELESSEVELRRAARERALELLYEAEIKGVDIDELVDELPIPPVELTSELVNGVDAQRERIDALLAERVAPRWSLSRLAAVDRSVLRLGVYELMEQPERSQAVIINEAVVLARRFGTEDSPRFVNGVLSAVAAEVRGGPDDADSSDPTVLAPEGPSMDEPSGARTPGPRGVDAVVVDMDGVIRHWDSEAFPAIERELGLPAGAVAAAAFEPERFERAMRGELSFDDWSQEIGAAAAAEHGCDPAALATAFGQVGWRIDESVLELLDRVRQTVPVGLLSNASSRLLDDLHLSGIVDYFDVVVGSADVGVIKPDAAAFHTVADKLGVPLERCLFVDDTPENVRAARDLGMWALQFSSLEELEAELSAAGILR